jgi:hypothetical protein
MEGKNLVLKYIQQHDEDSEEEMELELHQMEVTTFMLASMDEGGSSQQRGPRLPRQVVQRDIGSGHERIWADYFASTPVYGPSKFRRR